MRKPRPYTFHVKFQFGRVVWQFRFEEYLLVKQSVELPTLKTRALQYYKTSKLHTQQQCVTFRKNRMYVYTSEFLGTTVCIVNGRRRLSDYDRSQRTEKSGRR
jgi:hypothetical protein